MYFSDQVLLRRDGVNNYRIPSAVATKSGTVLAFVNNRLNTLNDHSEETEVVVCRKAAGASWETVKTVAGHKGISCMIDTAVYDEETDTVFCLFRVKYKPLHEFTKFTEEEREAARRAAEEAAKEIGIAPGPYAAVSRDDGKTWSVEPIEVRPNALGFVGSPHGGSAGITLKYGPHAGRLLCPARYASGTYSTKEELKLYCYNAAIYSDDHGKTWQTSLPVQVGTGEGTLAELGDGRVYYNSRAYFDDNLRYTAISEDGGESFGSFGTAEGLMEPVFGCNASLLRVTIDGKPMVFFANPRHDTKRVNMTISISYDEAASWMPAKLVSARPSAYSSLAWSEAAQRFFLVYETGEGDCYEGLNEAEFDLEWLLKP